eukprot:269393_1
MSVPPHLWNAVQSFVFNNINFKYHTYAQKQQECKYVYQELKKHANEWQTQWMEYQQRYNVKLDLSYTELLEAKQNAIRNEEYIRAHKLNQKLELMKQMTLKQQRIPPPVQDDPNTENINPNTTTEPAHQASPKPPKVTAREREIQAKIERIKNDISNKKALMAGVHKLDMDQYAQYKRDCGKLEDERVEQEQNLKQLLYHRNYKQNWRKERSQQLLELKKQQKEQDMHPKDQLNAHRTVGRPRIEHNLKSDLSGTIQRIADANSSADPRRRSEMIYTNHSVRSLTKSVNSKLKDNE